MTDNSHLERATELARPHHTHPNPRVGAVLVDDKGSVIGEGAHAGAGGDHAEVIAIRQAGSMASGSTLYVTLEPCVHHGRTPPCTGAIIEAGIKTVFIGVEDPDPRVAGKGIARLAAAGIRVVVSPSGAAAESLDPGYFHQRRTGLPRVILKYAMTLDGAVAARDGSSKWISGEEARADAHLLRAAVDAVIIGAGTLRADDPMLSVRSGEISFQPRPVVLAGTEDLPPRARLWQRDPIVISARDLDVPSGEVVLVEGIAGRPQPEAAARALADLGIYDALIEGGPTIAGSWWRAGLISSGVVYVSGKIGGGGGVGPLGGLFHTVLDATDVSVVEARRIGNDVRIEFQ